MQIELAVTSDIGQVEVGRGVVHYALRLPFRGEVLQVRLAATDTSNVITYPVMVGVTGRCCRG